VSVTTNRVIGIVICFAPVAVGLWSLCHALAHPEIPKWRVSLIGGFALVVVVFNLHTSYFRALLYRWRHGRMDGFRFASGMPLIGTIFILIESILGFGSLYTSLLVLLAYVLDTGGFPWLLVMTWRDDGVWKG
jgi:hypothetical protein